MCMFRELNNMKFEKIKDAWELLLMLSDFKEARCLPILTWLFLAMGTLFHSKGIQFSIIDDCMIISSLAYTSVIVPTVKQRAFVQRLFLACSQWAYRNLHCNAIQRTAMTAWHIRYVPLRSVISPATVPSKQKHSNTIP